MKYRVQKVIKETPSTVTLVLAGPKVDFLPGQFMMVTCSPKGQPVKRAFSLAASPLRNQLELCIKATPDGFVSPYLCNVKEGAELELAGPYGRFTFVEGVSNHVIFIGAGSGIAPLRSMMQYIENKKLDINVDLFYSNKTEKDIIYRKDFEEWQGHKRGLFLTLTQEEWTGKTGRFDLAFFKENISNLSKPLYYLCGPLQFVGAMREQLLEGGAKKDWIKMEVYE